MDFTCLNWILEYPPKTDKSALGTINDSVGKICPDKCAM
jgi:hypothetical protein